MKRRLICLIGFIFVFLCLAVTVGNGHLYGQAVVAEVPVGNWPLSIGVNSNTNRVYVTNKDSNTVSVIDGTTNKVITTIEVGTSPIGIGVNPNTNRVYVANRCSSNTVSVIDGVANKIITTLEVETSPDTVGVNPSTNRIYVAGSGKVYVENGRTCVEYQAGSSRNNTVSVIDGATNKIIATMGGNDCPGDVGVNPNTNRVYVSNISYTGFCMGDSSGKTVSLIDGATNKIVAKMEVGTSPYGVGINPNTNRVYVANSKSNIVSVIDGATNKVITAIEVGTSPHGVGINPNTNRIYVANSKSNTVSVIEGTATNPVNKRRDEFTKKFGVEKWPDISEFFANPFIYEGKIVALPVRFEEMQNATQGIFTEVGRGLQLFVVSDIPKGMFKNRGSIAVLAGKVLGKTELQVPFFGLMQVPHLKFVGVHFCKDDDCKDIIPECEDIPSQPENKKDEEFSSEDKQGILYAKNGQYEKAIAECLKALESDKGNLQTYYNLGIAYTKVGKLDDAIATWQKALTINPLLAHLHYSIGLAYKEKGNFELAEASLKKTLEINKFYPNAKNVLEEITSTKHSISK